MGRRLEGKLPWFFAIGYFAKEQVAIMVAILLIVANIIVCLIFRSKTVLDYRIPPLSFYCGLSLSAFGILMATQSNLVWNMRYLMPALPLIYLLVCSHLPSLNWKREILTYDTAKGANVSCLFLTLIMVLESCRIAPFHFSYINPVFGGRYRVPIALNDSNFDYGQDLFYINKWFDEQSKAESIKNSRSQIYGCLSGVGTRWLNSAVQPASLAVIRDALDQKKDTVSLKDEPYSYNAILIVSLGLTHPEPWAVRYSNLKQQTASSSLSTLSELLMFTPDEYITPAIAVYHFSKENVN